MSNPYRDKLLSIGVVSRLSRPVVSEGRQHPETGKAWKRTEDDGSIVTEHATKDDRVDATAKVAAPIRANYEEIRERKARTDRGNQG